MDAFLFKTCLDKQSEIKNQFDTATTPEETYRIIMELGRKLPPYPDLHKTPDNKVAGCQSTLYLHTTLNPNGTLSFSTFSDALISAGLAYLLTYVYSNELPEVILKCPPNFLDDLNIPLILSPSRSNGLMSLLLHMKQSALKAFTLP